jgi:hypothetical protein
MTEQPLSPAAQAVWHAYETANCDPYFIDPRQAGVAAALQAAADQVVPEEPLNGGDQRWMFERDARQASRKKLLAIAAELEAMP